jgi:hypothetical protein
LRARPQLNLIVTMDASTSTIYSALPIEVEGAVSTLRALLEVLAPRARRRA